MLFTLSYNVDLQTPAGILSRQYPECGIDQRLACEKLFICKAGEDHSAVRTSERNQVRPDITGMDGQLGKDEPVKSPIAPDVCLYFYFIGFVHWFVMTRAM